MSAVFPATRSGFGPAYTGADDVDRDGSRHERIVFVHKARRIRDNRVSNQFWHWNGAARSARVPANQRMPRNVTRDVFAHSGKRHAFERLHQLWASVLRRFRGQPPTSKTVWTTIDVFVFAGPQR